MLRKLVLTSLTAALALTGSACASTAQDAAPATATPTTTAVATTAASSGSTTTATAPAADEQQRFLTFITIGDDGASGPMIGCGDSAVAVPVDEHPDLPALMRAQLTAPEQVWVEAGLYNPLAYSELQLESAEIHDGTARIQLSGSLMLAGECDIPRVREQLTAPALQFDGVREVEVLINGEQLENVLDLRG